MITKTYTNGHHKLETSDKLLPQDKEAERALIACLLTDSELIHEVTTILSKEDFYLLANGTIFEAIQRVVLKGERADVINVMAELRNLGHADIGDGQNQAEAYLIDTLSSYYYFTYSVDSYARTIAEMATRRRLITAAKNITTAAWDEQQEIPNILEGARQQLFMVSERGTGRGLAHISKAISPYLDDMEHRFANPNDIPGLRTGFIDLDRILNGFKPNHLVILAGRPGMGKTALQLAMVDEMSVNNRLRGAFYSLEMGKGELINRIISRRIKVNTQQLEQGNLSESQQADFYAHSGRLSQAPLFIDDTPALTPEKIRASAMKQVLETGLDYLMVDYLGLVSVPGKHSRYEQVSMSSRFFKNLAKELGIPVIVASQLSRALEARADKRPQLADLRDSGEIEEAADVVISLYRDEYYQPDTTKRPGQGEAEILKHRGGPLGVVDLMWHSEYATYRNLGRTANPARSLATAQTGKESR